MLKTQLIALCTAYNYKGRHAKQNEKPKNKKDTI